MKKLFLMLLISLITQNSFTQETQKAIVDSKDINPVIVSGKEKNDLLKEVFKNEDFIKAITIIASDANSIIPNNGMAQKKGNHTLVSWDITGSKNEGNVDYKKLCYDFDGTKAIVYFDEKNEQFTPSPAPVSGAADAKLRWPPSWFPGGSGGAAAGLGFCWNWNPWVQVSSACLYDYWCPFHNQKAVFITETRACKNNPANTQTRTKKLHCGC